MLCQSAIMNTSETNKQRYSEMNNSTKAMKLAHKLFNAYKASGKIVLKATFGKLLKKAWDIVKRSGYTAKLLPFIFDNKLSITTGNAHSAFNEYSLHDGFKVNLNWYYAEQKASKTATTKKTLISKLKNILNKF